MLNEIWKMYLEIGLGGKLLCETQLPLLPKINDPVWGLGNGMTAALIYIHTVCPIPKPWPKAIGPIGSSLWLAMECPGFP